MPSALFVKLYIIKYNMLTYIGNSLISFISVPLNSKIISPDLIPALSDGLFSATLATSAPLGLKKFST